LTTLNLLEWPHGHHPGLDITAYTAVQSKLQDTACQLLEWARHTYHQPGKHRRLLEVIAFGSRELLQSPVPRYFVDGEMAALGRTRKVAVQVSLKDLYINGMAVDILHHEWRDWDPMSRQRAGSAFYRFDEDRPFVR